MNSRIRYYKSCEGWPPSAMKPIAHFNAQASGLLVKGVHTAQEESHCNFEIKA